MFGNHLNIWSSQTDKRDFRLSLHGFGLRRRIGWRHCKVYPNGVQSEDGQERYKTEISQLHTVVGVLKREKRMLNQT